MDAFNLFYHARLRWSVEGHCSLRLTPGFQEHWQFLSKVIGSGQRCVSFVSDSEYEIPAIVVSRKDVCHMDSCR
jgi:hypothetical protein